MQTRVLVSVLNAALDVSGNGSARSVTDSSAMARVEVSALISVGALSGTASATLAQMNSAKAREMDVAMCLRDKAGR